jgi:hypothetical protein
MFTHPTITQALAEQHRSDLINQASAYRLARTARQARSQKQPRPRLVIRALRATAAAAALAGAAFLVTPSGPAVAAGNGKWYVVTSHVTGNGKWTAHYSANSSHRTVLAVHFRSHVFGAGHVFGADHASGARWAV